MGYPRLKFSEEFLADVQAGMSLKDLGAKYGRHPVTIHHQIKAARARGYLPPKVLRGHSALHYIRADPKLRSGTITETLDGLERWMLFEILDTAAANGGSVAKAVNGIIHSHFEERRKS
jgi:hypothetical protein